MFTVNVKLEKINVIIKKSSNIYHLLQEAVTHIQGLICDAHYCLAKLAT